MRYKATVSPFTVINLNGSLVQNSYTEPGCDSSGCYNYMTIKTTLAQTVVDL